ncbi:hypothetical protein PAECIP111894_01200 [Paenibacillus pseudetheri]|uniref:Uncharacterized protein n=1 Tax=Paenibacillus pseudetheri TaxID=2897682 RepID=A0ABM9B989_9BACL|nr:hypothetical protein PAECIP111894_01200 [Paenibacillus pseudetheri]
MTQVIKFQPLTYEQVVKVVNLTKPKYIGFARANVREMQV